MKTQDQNSKKTKTFISKRNLFYLMRMQQKSKRSLKVKRQELNFMLKLSMGFKLGVIRLLSVFNQHLSLLQNRIQRVLGEKQFKTKSLKKSLKDYGKKMLRESNQSKTGGKMLSLNSNYLKSLRCKKSYNPSFTF